MPSVSKKQRNFMAAAAHNPAFAKKAGIPVSVAKEFNQADKGKKFRGGGMAKCKKYEEGGLTFAEMDESDRNEAARKAIEDLDARQAEKSKAAVAAPVKRATKSKPVDKGDTRENLRDLDMQGADTGYDATEARRNLARAGTRHAVGKTNIADRGYSATETKRNLNRAVSGMKKGGSVRGCGCAVKGKTKGRMV